MCNLLLVLDNSAINRLGREASNKLTVQDRIDMEKVDLEYEYITEIQDASPDIDMGIDMIKRGEH